MQCHPAGLQRPRQHGARLWGCAGQYAVGHFEQVNLGIEPGHGLGQLAAHGTRAEYCQAAGTLPEIEERLVGERIAVLQAGNRRHRSPRSGSDDEAPGEQAMRLHLDACVVEKPRRTEKYIHALVAVTLDRVMMSDLVANTPQPRECFVEARCTVPPGGTRAETWRERIRR